MNNYKEANYRAAQDHDKRLKQGLIAAIEFFKEEFCGEMLYVVHREKLDISPISEFVKAVKK